MARVENWQTNLSDLIRTRKETPFDPSLIAFNCLMWACEGVAAVTGEDHYSKFAGKFKTAAGAKKTLKKIGQANSCAEYLGLVLPERQALVFAKKGDIVVADPTNEAVSLPSDIDAFGPAVGICYGYLSFFVGVDGLVTAETLQLGPLSYGLHCYSC